MTEGRGAQGETPAGIVRPEAVVFDMDGLLLDTERIVLDGFLHACRTHESTPQSPTPTIVASAPRSSARANC